MKRIAISSILGLLAFSTFISVSDAQLDAGHGDEWQPLERTFDATSRSRMSIL